MQASRQSYFLAKSLRPASTLLPFLLSCSVLVAHRAPLGSYVLALLITVISYGLVTIYNDLSDHLVDTANKRSDIPLASSQITRGSLRQLATGLFAIGFVCALIAGQGALLWLGGYLFFGWLYSGPANFKGRGVLGVIILGLCYGVMPWLLGYSLTAAPITPWGFVLMAASFFFASGIVPLKDFKDVKGDALHNKKTLLVLYGSEKTHSIILATTTFAYAVLVAAAYSMAGEVLALLTVLILCLNVFLLASKNITTNRFVRKRSGSAARIVFFFYVAVLGVGFI